MVVSFIFRLIIALCADETEIAAPTDVLLLLDILLLDILTDEVASSEAARIADN